MVAQVSPWHKDAVQGHSGLLKQTHVLMLNHSSPFISTIPGMMSCFCESELHLPLFMKILVQVIGYPKVLSQRQLKRSVHQDYQETFSHVFLVVSSHTDWFLFVNIFRYASLRFKVRLFRLLKALNMYMFPILPIFPV